MKFTDKSDTNCNHIPYTYLLKFTNPSTGDVKFYYGMQYAKGSKNYPAAHPKNLWVNYFTSSKSVKNLIKEYGKDHFEFQIRHIFPNDPIKAADFEHKVLKRLKVVDNDKWLNKTDNKRCDSSNIDYSKIDYNKAKATRMKNNTWYKSWNKGLTYEEIYGEEEALRRKKICSNNGKKHKGKKKPVGFGKVISSHLKGRPKSDEHKAKLSESLSNRPPKTRVQCIHCTKQIAYNKIKKHEIICESNPNRQVEIGICLECEREFDMMSYNKKFCCNAHAQRYRKRMKG